MFIDWNSVRNIFLFPPFIYLYHYRLVDFFFNFRRTQSYLFALFPSLGVIFLKIVNVFRYRIVKKNDRWTPQWLFLERLTKTLPLKAIICGSLRTLCGTEGENPTKLRMSVPRLSCMSQKIILSLWASVSPQIRWRWRCWSTQDQWFSGLSMHINHLEVWLKPRSLFASPKCLIP